MSIEFSINTHYKNKVPNHLIAKDADKWQSVKGELQDLKDHVENGVAFVCAAMSSPRRCNSAFQYTDLIGVDVDFGLTIDQLKEHELASCIAWAYTTPSHTSEKHRFRVIFQLPSRLDNPALARAVTNVLIASLGGDGQCKDECRYFNGYDQCETIVWQPKAILPGSIYEDAAKEASRISKTYDRALQDYDTHTIEQAKFVLENVLGTDKDRERFMSISMACKTAGEHVFDSWAEWASRTHHGSGENSVRVDRPKFWNGLRADRTGLPVLFKMANEEEPGWRKKLPSELRQGNSVTRSLRDNLGYGFYDFLGEEEIDNSEPILPTQGLFASTALLTKPKVEVSGVQDIEPAIDQDEADNNDTSNRTITRRGDNSGDDGSTIDAIAERLEAHYVGLRLNVMSQELEYGPINDPVKGHDFSTAYINISRGSNKVFQKHHVFDLANVIGFERRYHPVRSYLNSCSTLEPCPYFKYIATELLGVDTDNDQNPKMEDGRCLADHIMERFLIGAVARVMEPGCRHDWMPVLIGGQNAGKSTFFQYLTRPDINDPGRYPWCATMQQGIEYLKDKPHALHSGWIVILDEAERYFKRKYTEELKNLISVSVDRSAKKYENEKNYPRSFVLAGATNNADFLCDPTGNRRFMPIIVRGRVESTEDKQLKIIDLDKLKQDRDSIWAAAYQAYLDNPVHDFTSYELSHISEYIDSFTKDNPIDERLKKILYGAASPAEFKLEEIFEKLEIPLDRHNSMTLPVTDSLKRLGWVSRRKSQDGKKRRFWIESKDAV